MFKALFFSFILWHCTFAFSFVKEISAFSGKELFSNKEISVDPQKIEKGTVVVFVSARCPCSASHEKIIKDMAEEFKDFKFIAIHSNRDESKEITLEHFKTSNLPLEIIQDDHAKLADMFKAFKTPHAFLINKKGEVVYAGGITNSHTASTASMNFLKEALISTRMDKKPKISEERSLGCIISRKE